ATTVKDVLAPYTKARPYNLNARVDPLSGERGRRAAAGLLWITTTQAGVPVLLVGPEPGEGGAGEDAVDEAVDAVLGDVAPGLAGPDAVGDLADAVGQERGGTHDAEDRHGTRTWRDGVPGEIRREDSHNQAID